ncbi:hypothetical protein [Sphingomonas sp. LHG3406-1]|uniref:hypothetical protein n=1 Tax=Sphingomonas sp. LHG3406-1 TaxID=2804617 RepID=UPI0026082084|nr:hypothetical protein [Sphingomonas sp. LHG3406-1]
MLALALMLAAAQPIASPPQAVRSRAVSARALVTIRIVQAAEVRQGRSSSPHQRRMRLDAEGRNQLLLEFE